MSTTKKKVVYEIDVDDSMDGPVRVKVGKIFNDAATKALEASKRQVATYGPSGASDASKANSGGSTASQDVLRALESRLSELNRVLSDLNSNISNPPGGGGGGGGKGGGSGGSGAGGPGDCCDKVLAELKSFHFNFNLLQPFLQTQFINLTAAIGLSGSHIVQRLNAIPFTVPSGGASANITGFYHMVDRHFQTVELILRSIANAGPGNSNTTNIQNITYPTRPSSQQVTSTANLLAAVNQRLQAAALAGTNFASNPAAAIGLVGSAIGGPFGVAIAGASALGNALMDASRALHEYNSDLFAAVTGFDLALMGLKFELADKIGPALASFLQKLLELIVTIEPLAADLINLTVAILNPMMDVLRNVIHWFDVLSKSLQLIVAWVDYKTSGGVTSAAQALGKAVTDPSGTMKMLQSSGMMSILESMAGARTSVGLDSLLNSPVNGVGGGKKFRELFNDDQVDKLRKSLEKGMIPHDIMSGISGTSGVLPAAKSKQKLEQDLVAANDALTKALNSNTEETKKNTEEMIEKGAAASRFLVDAVEMFSAGKGFSGLQGAGSGRSYISIPDLGSAFIDAPTKAIDRFVYPSGVSEDDAHTHLIRRRLPHGALAEGVKAGEKEKDPRKVKPDSDVIPRPTPAAVHLHTADKVDIHSDDEKLHQEFLMMEDRVMSAMEAFLDGRWMRLASARARLEARL